MLKRFQTTSGTSVKCWLSVIAGLSLAACAAAPAAAQVTRTFTTRAGAATNTTWQGAPGAGPTFNLGADVTTPPDALRRTRTFGFKAAGVTPNTTFTDKIHKKMAGGANNPNVWGRGRNDHSYVRTGLFLQNIAYTYNVGIDLTHTAAGRETVIGNAWHADPFGYVVGSPGTSVTFSHDLFSGTQLQRRDAHPDMPVPEINLYGRVGLGTASFSQENPGAFWANEGASPGPAPVGAADLFQITIRENATGAIDAVVDLFDLTGPATTGLSQTYDGSMDLAAREAAIEAMIESPASWSLADDTWTLNSNLHLFDYKLTNESSQNVDQLMTLGAFLSSGAAVPEPASLSCAGAAALGLLTARRRGSPRTR